MYWNLNQRIQDNAVDIGAVIETQEPVIVEENIAIPEFQGAFTLLLVGNDDGNGDEKYGARDHALNDVNILLHVSEDHSKATAISIPRDMFLDLPECTDPETGAMNPAINGVKANTALAHGGLKCAVDTFRKLTGEPINYAAMIQFNGVIALSNSVGGVPVCVTTDINDPDSGLKMTAGEHTVSGDEALAFLRTRHGVGDGSDLARISNQQTFMSSLMRTLKSKSTLSDPAKVFSIANTVADNMTLSTNLASIPTLASLAYSLKDILLEDITFIQYPTTYVTYAGMDGVAPVKASAAVMIDAVFNDKGVTLTGGTAPGNVGAVAKEELQPTATPTISSQNRNAEPATPVEEAEEKPSSSETPVALPTDVTGITASQSTCSRGFGDY